MAGGSSGDVCRDFLRNVCKRGRRCKFLHPEVSEAADTAEEPALVRGEAPVCRDHQNGECQRGAKCKFRHFERESPEQVRSPIVYHMDPYHTELYEEQALKRRRLESLRFDLYDHGVPRPFPVDYRYLEEENLMLHKRVEELKKQASNLMATNEVLLEQNALYRNQPKMVTLTTTAGAEQQLAPPTVATVTAYNHTIVQAHNSLSSQALQPRQEMVAHRAGAGSDHRPEHGNSGDHDTGHCVHHPGHPRHHSQPRHHAHGQLCHRLPEHEDHTHATLRTSPPPRPTWLGCTCQTKPQTPDTSVLYHSHF